MSMSDLTDQDVLALNDVLMALRDAYDRAINGTTIIKEMTGENLQEAYEGLALFGKRMMDFEDSLRNITEVKRDIDLLLRSSQIQAKRKDEANCKEKNNEKDSWMG
jgi:hypothetical protein